MNKNKNSLVVFVFSILLLISFRVLANEAGAEHEEGIPKVVFYQALNFFGLLAILFFLLKPKVGGFFKQRHDAVAGAIKEANRIKTEAEEKHKEYMTKIQELQRQQDQILMQIQKDAEEAKRRIVEEAKRMSQVIRDEAKRTVENETERARAELYDDVLQQSLEGARQILVKSVAENDQRRLQKEFVEKIEAVQ